MARDDVKEILQAIESLRAEIAKLKENVASNPSGKIIFSFSEMKKMGYSDHYLEAAYLSPGQDFATKITPAAKSSKIIFNLPKFEAWQQRQIKAQATGRRR